MKLLTGVLAASLSLAVPAPQDMMRSIPLHFEPNLGQTDSRVRFTARGGGMSIFLTGGETVFARPGGDPVRMKLRGSKAAKFEALEKLPGVSNYYRGNDPKKWREGVPHYARVRAKSVYEGVDIVYYGNERRLEYDFVVAPGADASKIELAYEGTRSMRVAPDGDLVLVTKGGELRQKKPVVYQEVEGRRVEVAASYRIAGPVVRFELAKYDAERALVIDPILEYGTFLNGSGVEVANGVAVDGSGAIVVAGTTTSADFPMVNAAFTAPAQEQGFVTKLNPAGTALVYSTFMGGSPISRLYGLALDASGNAYVAGYTFSTTFPVLNAVQPDPGGGGTDGFVARLGSAGQLAFATYLGGSSQDDFYSIAVNATGIAVAGSSGSQTLTGGAGGGVVVKLAIDGSAIQFTKSIASGPLRGIAMDSTGAAYVTGTVGSGLPTTPGAYQTAPGGSGDAFAAKLSASGTQWVFVTYIGGAGSDTGSAIAVDTGGRAAVAGTTDSADFPLKNAALSTQVPSDFNGFLTVLNASGTGIDFSTQFGGELNDYAQAVAAAPAGGGFVVGGRTRSSKFPLDGSWRWKRNTFEDSGFAVRFRADGSLVYSSVLAADSEVLSAAFTPASAAVLAGATPRQYRFDWSDSDLATPGSYTPSAGVSGAFVARFVDGPTAVPVTVNTVPQGRIVVIDGQWLRAPVTLRWQPGTPHQLYARLHAENGVLYSYSSWSNGAPEQHSLVGPDSPATFTASFSQSPCLYAFTPPSLPAVSIGQRVTITMATQYDCQWTPVSTVPWLAVQSPGERSGPGDVFVTVAPNTGGPRSATITHWTAAVTIQQAGGLANLAAPSITSPANGQVIQTKLVNLSWTPVPGAFAYEVRAYNSLNVQPVLVHSSQQGAVAATSQSLELPDGPYLILVRACSSAGYGEANCGGFGSINVTVDRSAPTSAPTVLTPSSGQVLTSSTNLISWQQVPGATSYEVTLTDQQPTRPSQVDLHINTPTLGTVFTMRSSTQYVLTVRACNEKCSSIVSTVSFRTVLPPLAQTPPTGLVSQINGNILNLTWNPVTNADLYRVQVVQPSPDPEAARSPSRPSRSWRRTFRSRFRRERRQLC